MNRLKSLGLTAIALTMFVATQAAANHLLNAGFETDAVENQELLPVLTDWQAFGNFNTASKPLAPVRTGIGSLALVGAGGFGVPGAFQNRPASPGQLWDLQGYMLTEELLGSANTRGLIKIVFNGEGGVLDPIVLIGDADAAPFLGIQSTPQLRDTATLGTWQFTQAQGIAPPGTISVDFFALFVDELPGTVYFDDLKATLAGDFDSDFDVDDADFLEWKRAFGENGNANGDADGDNDSDGADFLLWQRYYNPVVIGAGAVPEPATAVLLMAGLAVVGWRARMRRG